MEISIRKFSKEVTISQLGIGYTRFTHSFILGQEEKLQCIVCQTPYTVKHSCIECGDLSFIRLFTK